MKTLGELIWDENPEVNKDPKTTANPLDLNPFCILGDCILICCGFPCTAGSTPCK